MDKAQAAKNLLMDEFFMAEIQSMKDGCLQAFQNSRPDEYEEREAAYRRLSAINEMMAHFESIAAEKKIEQKRRKFF